MPARPSGNFTFFYGKSTGVAGIGARTAKDSARIFFITCPRSSWSELRLKGGRAATYLLKWLWVNCAATVRSHECSRASSVSLHPHRLFQRRPRGNCGNRNPGSDPPCDLIFQTRDLSHHARQRQRCRYHYAVSPSRAHLSMARYLSGHGYSFSGHRFDSLVPALPRLLGTVMILAAGEALHPVPDFP